MIVSFKDKFFIYVDYFVYGENNGWFYEVDEEYGFLDDVGGFVENGQDVYDNDQFVG